MNEASACTGFINNDGDLSVTALNSKLIGLAINMKNEISNMQTKSESTNSDIEMASGSLDNIIASLKTKRETISKLKKEIISLNGNIQDNTHLVKSLNIRYMAWVLSFVTIILLGIYKIKK
jgi:chromosome segregation ATPase